MTSKGRDLHQQSLVANESKDYQTALHLEDDAMVAYAEEKDDLGFSEILAMRTITLRALANKTGNNSYLLVAASEISAAIDISKSTGDKTGLAVPYLNLGKILEALGKPGEAVTAYSEALENIQDNPPPGHKNRPAVVLDFKSHLLLCQYGLSGEEKTLISAIENAEELEKTSDVDPYSLANWTADAYTTLGAKIFEKTKDKERALIYFKKAEKVVAANPKLIVRKEMLEKALKNLRD